MSRRKSREYTLKILYLIDNCNINEEEARKIVKEKLTEEEMNYADRLIFCALQNKEKIDEMISTSAKNWTIDRMSVIDKNLLRMGISEMISEPSLPVSIVINEAIEIAKKYSSEKSSKFINGILDSLKVVREEYGRDKKEN